MEEAQEHVGIGSLSLGDDGDEGIVFTDIDDCAKEPTVVFDSCLVGRFLTERPVNFVAMKNTMASLWRPEEGMTAREMGDGLYVFQFGAEVELKRVLDMCPWTFNNQLLILDRLDGHKDPRDVPLHHMFIWVQVHGLRRGFFSDRVAQRLDAEIGEFMESDPKNYSNPWATYLRIRVKVDVRKPLRKGTKMKKEGEEWFHVSFAYERLPTFCFVCGCLGHGERFCPAVLKNWGQEITRNYGPELRAQSRKPVNSIGSKWLRDELPVHKKETEPGSTAMGIHQSKLTACTQLSSKACETKERQIVLEGGAMQMAAMVISDPKKRKVLIEERENPGQHQSMKT
ncbi:unnamed protein product [Cuscuta campestris]|uniref:CCHC-type domain-containing protein n=1 Tax=Cuscuta campestris TaxID=132261 RepID=A0A484N209_9ASTE|nr:unnamed protein product [Cuscuta campestris]